MTEQKNGEIILFGYGNYILEEQAGITHLDALMRDPNTYIADIRLKPFSSKDFPIWHGYNLASRYGRDETGKTRYVWIEELGNLNYKPEDRDKGFALKEPEIGLSRLIHGLSFGRRLVVLCGCKHYLSCHRSLVAQLLLSELPSMMVTHVEQIERRTAPVAETMKCLSIRQPWCHFIAAGIKDVENRDWNTKYRGPVLLHAGVKAESSCFDRSELSDAMIARYQLLAYDVPLRKKEYTTGAIIGVAELVDVVTKSESRWFTGEYGFVFERARLFKTPVPYAGQLNFFDVPLSVVSDAIKRLDEPEPEVHVPVKLF